MIDRYKIIELGDTEKYYMKYKYCVLVFCGMKANGKPIYRIIKQTRNEQRAQEYINKQIQKGQTQYI